MAKMVKFRVKIASNLLENVTSAKNQEKMILDCFILPKDKIAGA